MQSKSYTVIIQIDFNTINCPGVYLCPKGKAFLKVCLFGIADLTKDVDPFFPLTIRERFIFEKDFRNVSSIYELHDKVGRSVISIELLQCPVGSPGCVKLAIFNSLLTDLLHPYSSCFVRPPDTTGIELLFTTCKIFPGILAPKADVSVKVSVHDSHGGGGKPTVRRVPLKIRKATMKRQKPVCHTKNGLNCDCFTKNSRQTGGHDKMENGDGAEPQAHASRKPRNSRLSVQGSTVQRDFFPKQRQYFQASTQQEDNNYYYPEEDSEIDPSDSDEPSMEQTQRRFVYGDRAINNEIEECEKLLKNIDPGDVDPILKMKYSSCVAEAQQKGAGGSVYQGKTRLASKGEVENNMTQGFVSEGKMNAASKPRPVEIPCHGKCCKCADQAEKSEEELQNENEASTFAEMRTPRLRKDDPMYWILDPQGEERDRDHRSIHYRREKESKKKRQYESFTMRDQLPGIEPGGSARPQRNTQDVRMDDQGTGTRQPREPGRTQGSQPTSDSLEDRQRGNGRGDQRMRPSAGDQIDARPRRPQPNVPSAKRPTASKIPRPITGPAKPGEDRGRPSQAASKKKPSTEPQFPRSSQQQPPNSQPPRQPPGQPPRPPPVPPPSQPPKPEEGDSSGDCDCNLCEQYQEMYNPDVHPCPYFRNTVRPNRQKSPTRPKTGGRKLVASRRNGYGTPWKQPPRYDRDRDRENEECGLFTCDGPIDIEAMEEMNAIQKFYYGK